MIWWTLAGRDTSRSSWCTPRTCYSPCNVGSTSCAALSSYPAQEVVQPGNVVGVADAVKWCVRCPLAVRVPPVSDTQATAFDPRHAAWVVSEWLARVP